MLALTMWEPWGSALVYGPKDVENRPWKPPFKVSGERVLGSWVLIHTGQTWDSKHSRSALEQWSVAEPETMPSVLVEALQWTRRLNLEEMTDRRRCLARYGAFIGAVKFAGALEDWASRGPTVVCASNEALLAKYEIAARADGVPWWSRDEIGWVREDSVRFPAPVPYRRGLQKLWTPPKDVVETCRAQLDWALRGRGEETL